MQLPTIRSQWLSFSFLCICFAVAVPIASADEQRLLVTSDNAKIQSGNDVLAHRPARDEISRTGTGRGRRDQRIEQIFCRRI